MHSSNEIESNKDIPIGGISQNIDSMNDEGYRVKLYLLEGEGTWGEIGTCKVVCKCVSIDGNDFTPALVMRGEHDQNILLQSRIQFEDVYERQGESIIMWREISQDGHESDYAISFEHTSACRFIWDSIGEVQSQYLQQNEYGTNPSFAHLSSSNSIDDVNKADEYRISSTSEKSGRLRSNSYGSTSQCQSLPPISKENLLELRAVINQVSQFEKSTLVEYLLASNASYLRKLLELFSQLEEEYWKPKNIECDISADDDSIANLKLLNTLSDIWRSILMLNDSALIHFSLSDSNYLQVFGIFEYDPQLRQLGNHRDFFIHHVQLKQVVPIKDEELVNMIQSLYRMRYLRDYLIRPCIDEAGSGALNVTISATTVEIATRVFHDSAYLQQIFDVILIEQSQEHNRASWSEKYEIEKSPTVSRLRHIEIATNDNISNSDLELGEVGSCSDFRTSDYYFHLKKQKDLPCPTSKFTGVQKHQTISDDVSDVDEKLVCDVIDDDKSVSSTAAVLDDIYDTENFSQNDEHNISSESDLSSYSVAIEDLDCKDRNERLFTSNGRVQINDNFNSVDVGFEQDIESLLLSLDTVETMSHSSQYQSHHQLILPRDSAEVHADYYHKQKDSNDNFFKAREKSGITIEESILSHDNSNGSALHTNCNSRLDGIRFLRELFFMSRNFYWDRRYELYKEFLDRFRDQFFKLLMDILASDLPQYLFNVSNNQVASAAAVSEQDNKDVLFRTRLEVHARITNVTEKQLLMEIMSLLTSVCVWEVRGFILSSTTPPSPPMPSTVSLSKVPTASAAIGLRPSLSSVQTASSNVLTLGTRFINELGLRPPSSASLITGNANVGGVRPQSTSVSGLEYPLSIISSGNSTSGIRSGLLSSRCEASAEVTLEGIRGNLLCVMFYSLLHSGNGVVIEHISDTLKYLLEASSNHHTNPCSIVGTRSPYGYNSPSGPNDSPVPAASSSGPFPPLGPPPSIAASSSNRVDSERFSSLFYDHYIHYLLLPFNDYYINLLQQLLVTGDNKSEQSLSALVTSRTMVLDLLTLCVGLHAYRMKYLVMRNNILSKLNKFFSSIMLPDNYNKQHIRKFMEQDVQDLQPELNTSSRINFLDIIVDSDLHKDKPIDAFSDRYRVVRPLQSHVLKFWRAVLGSKDEFYNRHIVKHDLFRPILNAFFSQLKQLIEKENNRKYCAHRISGLMSSKNALSEDQSNNYSMNPSTVTDEQKENHAKFVKSSFTVTENQVSQSEKNNFSETENCDDKSSTSNNLKVDTSEDNVANMRKHSFRESYREQESILLSSMLDLLRLIRTEHISSLLVYITEKYLISNNRLDIFQSKSREGRNNSLIKLFENELNDFKLRYDQIIDRVGYSNASSVRDINNSSDNYGQRPTEQKTIELTQENEIRRHRNRMLHEVEQEEAYFDEDEDDLLKDSAYGIVQSPLKLQHPMINDDSVRNMVGSSSSVGIAGLHKNSLTALAELYPDEDQVRSSSGGKLADRLIDIIDFGIKGLHPNSVPIESSKLNRDNNSVNGVTANPAAIEPTPYDQYCFHDDLEQDFDDDVTLNNISHEQLIPNQENASKSMTNHPEECELMSREQFLKQQDKGQNLPAHPMENKGSALMSSQEVNDDIKGFGKRKLPLISFNLKKKMIH